MIFTDEEFNSPEAQQALFRHSFWTRADRDPRICICGHGMKNHPFSGEEVKERLAAEGRPHEEVCTVARLGCPCGAARPVLLTRDIRKFLHKSVGRGQFDHALMMGALQCHTEHIETAWLVPRVCDLCQSSTAVRAVGLDARGSVSPVSVPDNVLLCLACYTERMIS